MAKLQVPPPPDGSTLLTRAAIEAAGSQWSREIVAADARRSTVERMTDPVHEHRLVDDWKREQILALPARQAAAADAAASAMADAWESGRAGWPVGDASIARKARRLLASTSQRAWEEGLVTEGIAPPQGWESLSETSLRRLEEGFTNNKIVGCRVVSAIAMRAESEIRRRGLRCRRRIAN